MTWENTVLLLRLNRRAVAFSMANVARVIMTPSLTYVFVVTLQQGVAGMFAAKLIALGSIVGLLLLMTRREFTSEIRPSVFREVLWFGIPGHPGVLIRASMNVLPQYLLAAVAPLSAVGLFGIALRICTVIKIFVNSFNLAWNPFAYRNEGAPDEQRLYETVYRGFTALTILVALVLTLFSQEVLRLLAPPQFHAARLLVPAIAVYFGAQGLTTILSTILYTRQQVRWTSYLNVVRLAVFLVLGLGLVPRFHAHGLVIAMAFSSLVFLYVYLIRARSMFWFDVPWRGMAIVTALSVGSVWGLETVDWPTMTSVVAKLGILVLVGVASLRLLLTAQDRRALSRRIRWLPRQSTAGGVG